MENSKEFNDDGLDGLCGNKAKQRDRYREIRQKIELRELAMGLGLAIEDLDAPCAQQCSDPVDGVTYRF